MAKGGKIRPDLLALFIHVHLWALIDRFCFTYNTNIDRYRFVPCSRIICSFSSSLQLTFVQKIALGSNPGTSYTAYGGFRTEGILSAKRLCEPGPKIMDFFISPPIRFWSLYQLDSIAAIIVRVAFLLVFPESNTPSHQLYKLKALLF